MATSTRSSTSRARSGSSRSSSSTRNQPTKRYPAPKKAAAYQDEPGLLSVMWMGLAHLVGGAARLFGRETLAKDERRDGVPFFLIVLAVGIAAVEWFAPSSEVAIVIDAYSVGGLFGRLSFALPVILLVLAIWLFRHPATVHDNGRLGIGLFLLVASVSALCHVFGGQPGPDDGAVPLAHGGGLLGWVVTAPFTAIGAVWLAVPVVAVLALLSIFIITKTPPNRIGHRFRELYSYLFGAELPEPQEKAPKAAKDAVGETGAFGTLSDLGLGVAGTEASDDPSSMPWWRRGKKDEPHAFDSPVVGREYDATDVIEPSLNDDADFGIDLLEELVRAEDAVKRFTGEVDTGATTIREDATGLLPGFPDTASERGRAGEFEGAAAARRAAPRRPYRLPAASLLAPGTPPKAARQ